jgi:hypothetical protein
MADPDVLGDLLKRDDAGSSADEVSDRFSLILHDLRMGGSWKRTNRGRLRRTEEMLCTHLSPELRRKLNFLDIGASDGITTLDAVRTLRRAFGGEVQAFLADRNVWLLRYRQGPLVEYRAVDGEPIMARFGPLGIRLARQRRMAEDSRDPLARAYLRLTRLRESMRLDARMSLVNPAAKSDPAIIVIEFDCCVYQESLKGTMSAVRASNVLNLGYFGLPELRRAVTNIHAYLQEAGCLVISRNDDQSDSEVENGSVWLREGSRFRWLQDFGAGSEIRSVVDDWPQS